MQRKRQPLVDMTGQVYNKLTVLRYVGKSRWICRCECGEEVITSRTILISNRIIGCKKCGRCRNWSEEEIKHIMSSYEDGVSTTKLGKEFNCYDSNIGSLLQRNGIKLRSRSEANRKYSLDEDSFSEITPESAYWAGFIMADGSLSEKPHKHKVLCIELSIKDEDHLKKLQSFLKTDKPLYYRSRNSFGKMHKYCRLEISSEVIFNDLQNNFGITSNKTFNAQASEQAALSRDFWRGMVDGDGWIINTEYQSLALIGPLPIITQFRNFVAENLNINLKCLPNGKIFKLVSSENTAVKLATLLYDNALVYLDRKQKIYMSKYAK